MVAVAVAGSSEVDGPSAVRERLDEPLIPGEESTTSTRIHSLR